MASRIGSDAGKAMGTRQSLEDAVCAPEAGEEVPGRFKVRTLLGWEVSTSVWRKEEVSGFMKKPGRRWR